jgi:hypothetical protein
MRNEATKVFAVGNRRVTVKVMSEIAVEDVYDVLFSGIMHIYATGEDTVRPVPREVKDYLIRTNLNV